MNKIIKDSILLMTACVNPSSMIFTKLQNSEDRLKQYIEAVRFYLDNYSYKILLVENTEVDLSIYFRKEISENRLECLTFNGNSFDKSLGKGYGEGLIIKYAFENSILLKNYKYIIKISGRHKVLNLQSIILTSEFFLNSNQKLIVCEVEPSKKFARSDCYITSIDFYTEYLIKDLHLCNDSNNIWFEHILYNSITKAKNDGFQFLYLPFALDQRGYSGTNGERFRKTRLRRKIRFFLRMLLYKIGLIKIN